MPLRRRAITLTGGHANPRRPIRRGASVRRSGSGLMDPPEARRVQRSGHTLRVANTCKPDVPRNASSNPTVLDFTSNIKGHAE